MRLVVTGGGTGGHVYPALETAQGARAQGWDVTYMGSQRGQEGAACQKAEMPFLGFESEPVYRLLSPKGLRAMLRLLRASRQAEKVLEQSRPDVVFSTGGYSSAPIVQAARRLGIPFVIHEQNSVPGRTNKILGQHAHRICTVFHKASAHFPKAKVARTGMPIRQVLREGAQGQLPFGNDWSSPVPLVFVVGGSQGSAALNDAALATAVRMVKTECRWLHVAGTKHIASVEQSLGKMAVSDTYDARAFLEAEQMSQALFACSLAVCRSGAGTLSELAAFRRPAILVPYPHAHSNHQLHNALEFEEMGAAEVLQQSDLQPSALEVRILAWLNDEDRVRRAQEALAEWDILDSVARILSELKDAAGRGRD